MNPTASVPSLPLTTPCIECFSDIPATARLCVHCDSYQSRWKNRLRYLSTIAGIVTGIGAALVYIVTAAPEIRRALAWSDSVEVLHFTTRKGVSILNVGDGAVFVSDISIIAKSADGKPLFARTFRVGKDIEREKFMSSIGDDEKLAGRGLGIPSHPDIASWDSSLKDAGTVEEVLAEKKCHLWVVYQADDPLLTLYREQMGASLRTFPVNAELHVYSVKKKEMFAVPLKVVGILHKSTGGRCGST